MTDGIILNEKELREARVKIAKLTEALSSDRAFAQAVLGLPPEVISQVTKMMEMERQSLTSFVSAYELARETGNPAELQRRASRDPGLMLIVARIARGFSQKDLAWRLGVKEQQVQRYESDRYATISLKNYSRVGALLGVQLQASIHDNPKFRGLDAVIADVSKEDIKKILKHGRAFRWFEEDMNESQLRQYIAENRIEFGSPSLLRTGLNVTDHSEDVLLHAWRARIASVARSIIEKKSVKFELFDIRWLIELVKQSIYDDGPLRAQKMLLDNGIVLVPERQIPGLLIDGAAFLEGNIPVIGLTLRRDTIDNFWFTLLHEVGHVILHYRTGLAMGFFDQVETISIDEQEAEADLFASNILIPEEKWKRSTARIAKSPDVIERFARELGIHPAIVFGRIRKERSDYTVFANKIGRDTIRRQFFDQGMEG